MQAFDYYPSTTKHQLRVDDVILIKRGNKVTLLREDTDMVRIYPEAVYSFRVKSLKYIKPLKTRQYK